MDAALKDELLGRVPTPEGVGCFMCRLILEDISRNGCLTGAVLDLFGKPIFPPEGMIRHLEVEGFICLVPTEWLEK